MSGRKNREKINPFAADETDLEAVANQIYGAPGGEALDTGRVVARPIPIADIRPDPVQPRRAMPSKVRQAVRSILDPQEALEHWAVMAFEERYARKPVDAQETHQTFMAIVSGQAMDEHEPAGVAEATLLQLADLAASILRDGLMHPIHVAPDRGRKYRVIAGERRWLAHQLLVRYGHAGYERIPVIEGEADVWKQASENSQRSDLNAIGRARQYALLLMDLLEKQEGRRFESIYQFDHEQQFYAQVAQDRIPYGHADRLMNAMGLRTRQSLNIYHRLLLLPPEIWIRGDDENWPVNDLLQIVKSFDNLAPEDMDKPRQELVQTAKPPAPAPSALAGQGAAPDAHIPNIPNPPPPAAGPGYEEGRPEPDAEPVRGRWPIVGDKVLTHNGLIGQVEAIISPNQVQVRIAGRGSSAYQIGALQPYNQDEQIPFQIGDRVLIAGRIPGTVKYIKGGRFGVTHDSSGTTHYYDANDLTPLEEEPAPVAAPDSPQGEAPPEYIWGDGRPVTPDEQAAYEQAQTVGEEKPRSGQGQRMFAPPFTLRRDDHWWIADSRSRLVATWKESPAAAAESVEWIEWMLAVANSAWLNAPVQALLRVMDYAEGTSLDDYLPDDAMADLDTLREFIDDMQRTAQQDMDDLGGGA